MDINRISIVSSVSGGHTGLLCMSDDKIHLKEFERLTEAFKAVVGGGENGQRNLCINDQRSAS